MPLNETKTVLYFLADGKKTDEDKQAIAAINGAFEKVKVYLRNGAVINNGSTEPADFVAGPQVPPEYARKYPTLNADGTPPEGWEDPNGFRPSGEGFTAGSAKSEEAQAVANEVGSVSGGWNT